MWDRKKKAANKRDKQIKTQRHGRQYVWWSPEGKEAGGRWEKVKGVKYTVTEGNLTLGGTLETYILLSTNVTAINLTKFKK